MLGTPLSSGRGIGFDYDQQSAPTGAIPTGATWRQRNSENVPIRDRVWDGNMWRLLGGKEVNSRSIIPASWNVATGGNVTSAVASTNTRNFNCTAAGTGSIRAVVSSGISNSAWNPLLGSPNNGSTATRGSAIFDTSKPVELYTRIRFTSVGVFRLQVLTNTGSGSALVDLAGPGFGGILDLNNGTFTAELHNGTSRFTQALTVNADQWASLSPRLLDIEFVWDGIDKFGIYLNNVFAGHINQAITNATGAFCILAGYSQAGEASAQALSIYHFEGKGNVQ